MAKLDYIQLDTGKSVDACVIWLHGLGADGSDFVPVVEQMQLPADLPLRFIFPHAPELAVTINQGYVMPAWYDISSADIAAQEDVSGIEASSAAIDELIEAQLELGIAPGRILLAGFSQGGVIALHCGLRRSAPGLGGSMALSCYLPRCAELLAGPEFALFIGHGRQDPVIPVERGRESQLRLERAGYSPEWHEYGMEHSVCSAEIADLRGWLLARLDSAAICA